MNFPRSVPIKGRIRCCLELLLAQDIKGKRVADIGCTFGWLEEELKDSGAMIDGIDPNEEAINFAKKSLKNRNINFQVGDALQIPLKDKTYDLALFFDVIEHLPKGSEVAAMKEINRILKRGGLLLLSTPNSYPPVKLLDPAWYLGHRHYSVDDISRLLTAANFKIMNVYQRGRFFSIAYLLWFYFSKQFLGKKTWVEKWLEKMDDNSHIGSGFYTHYITAEKKI